MRLLSLLLLLFSVGSCSSGPAGPAPGELDLADSWQWSIAGEPPFVMQLSGGAGGVWTAQVAGQTRGTVTVEPDFDVGWIVEWDDPLTARTATGIPSASPDLKPATISGTIVPNAGGQSKTLTATRL
jgi:hypothetical protein